MKYLETLISGAEGRPMLTDARWTTDGGPRPIVVFAHGFKGFKDWGHFNLLAEAFMREGFVFVKFNFSHNGVTPDAPTEFTDLEAFGRNNYLLELEDLGHIFDAVCDGLLPAGVADHDRLYLMGHSRGGSIAVVKAAEDKRVRKLATWAAVADLAERFDAAARLAWARNGVIYVPNTRTGQQMPLYRQLGDVLAANAERLNVEAAAARLTIPYLIVHGAADESVPFADAENLKGWQPRAQIVRLEEGDHSFGGAHPWPGAELPAAAARAVRYTADFFAETAAPA